MACGVPVITSSSSSLGDVVGDAAYLVADPHDARQLGAAIISLVVALLVLNAVFALPMATAPAQVSLAGAGVTVLTVME